MKLSQNSALGRKNEYLERKGIQKKKKKKKKRKKRKGKKRKLNLFMMPNLSNVPGVLPCMVNIFRIH